MQSAFFRIRDFDFLQYVDFKLEKWSRLIGQIHQEGGELVFKTQSIFFKKNLPLFERATARNSEIAISQI